MTPQELQLRIRVFGNRIVEVTSDLMHQPSSASLGRQVIRSATSAAANYRAACRPKSSRDFINKLKITEEELDETAHWLTTLEELGFIPPDKLADLQKEVNELLSIIVRSIVTAKANQRKRGKI